MTPQLVIDRSRPHLVAHRIGDHDEVRTYRPLLPVTTAQRDLKRKPSGLEECSKLELLDPTPIKPLLNEGRRLNGARAGIPNPLSSTLTPSP